MAGRKSKRPESPARRAPPSGLGSEQELQEILRLLRAQTGNDFSQYKTGYVQRGIERRMARQEIGRVAQYVCFLSENPGELAQLFAELLIGVTSFFRDPESWDLLRRVAWPGLLGARAGASVLRAWVPGCSTGEEAYSLAMALHESIEPNSAQSRSLQIFATDLNRAAIDRACQGTYPGGIAANVSPERLRRFFVPDSHGYRIHPQLRERVVFSAQNLILDPPLDGLDLISCRNVLIYLSRELQRTLLALFHRSLNPGGLLFLGSAENVGVLSALFAPLDSRVPLYRRLAPP